MNILNLLVTYGNNLLIWIEGFVTYTTAYALSGLAIAFYVYSSLNVTIPKWIVSPIIALLVGVSFFIQGINHGTATEKALNEAKAREAQETYNKKYLDLALDLKTLQARFNNEKNVLNQQHNVEQQQLQNIIDQLQAEETPNEPQSTVSEPKIPIKIIYVPSNKCLSTSIPPSILQSINKAGSGISK